MEATIDIRVRCEGSLLGQCALDRTHGPMSEEMGLGCKEGREHWGGVLPPSEMTGYMKYYHAWCTETGPTVSWQSRTQNSG